MNGIYTYERQGTFYRNLDWEQYHKIINPNNEFINQNNRPVLHLADMEEMFNSVEVYRNTYLSSGEKLVIKMKDGNMWGEIDDKIVGFISLRGSNLDELMGEGYIDLAVAEEFQKKGIGIKLLLEFRKEFPFKQTGGLTEIGLKLEKKVFYYLRKRLIEQRYGL